MSRQPVIEIRDDLDGQVLGLDQVHVAQVGWDGKWHALDLSEENYTAVREMILGLLPARKPARAPHAGRRYSGSFYAELRQWADDKGRSGEIKTEPSGKGTGTKKKYGRQLIADFIAERHPEQLAESA